MADVGPNVRSSPPVSSADRNFIAAQAEITRLRDEVKRLKALTNFQHLPSTSNTDASVPSKSFEEAEARRIQVSEALDISNKKLQLSKKELDDAVTKYRLLARDTAKSREADKDSHATHHASIEKLKDMHGDMAEHHDKEVGIHHKKIGFLTHECAIKDEHIHRLKKSLRDAVKSKHDDLQSVLDSHGKHKGAHAKELSKVVCDLDSAHNDHLRTKQVLDDHKDHIQSLESEIAQLRNAAQNSASRISELESQLKSMDQELKSANTKLTKLGLDNAALGKANEELKHELDKMKVDLAAANRDKDRLQSQLDQSRHELEERTSSHQQDTNALKTEIKSLRDENSRLKTEKETISSGIQQLKKDVAAAKSQANDANAAKDQAARDAANASRRAEQLTKDLHDKDDAHQLEKATFLKQIDELMRKNKKLEGDNELLKRKLEKAVADAAAAANAAKAKHQGELGDLHNQLDAAKAALKSAQSIIGDHQAENRGLQADNKGLENKIGKLENAVDQGRKQIDKIMQQKDNLKQELDNTAAMLSAGQRENERLRNEAAQARAQNEKLDHENEVLNAKNHQLQADNRNLNSQLGQQAKNLSKTTTETNSTIEGINKKLEEAVRNHNKLQSETIPGLQSDLADKEKELKEAYELLAKQREKMVKLTEHTHTTTKQRLPPGVQDKIDSLSQQLRLAQQLSAALQNEMVPIEETTHVKTSTYHEEHYEGAEVLQADFHIKAQAVGVVGKGDIRLSSEVNKSHHSVGADGLIAGKTAPGKGMQGSAGSWVQNSSSHHASEDGISNGVRSSSESSKATHHTDQAGNVYGTAFGDPAKATAAMGTPYPPHGATAVGGGYRGTTSRDAVAEEKK